MDKYYGKLDKMWRTVFYFLEFGYLYQIFAVIFLPSNLVVIGCTVFLYFMYNLKLRSAPMPLFFNCPAMLRLKIFMRGRGFVILYPFGVFFKYGSANTTYDTIDTARIRWAQQRELGLLGLIPMWRPDYLTWRGREALFNASMGTYLVNRPMFAYLIDIIKIYLWRIRTKIKSRIFFSRPPKSEHGEIIKKEKKSSKGPAL